MNAACQGYCGGYVLLEDAQYTHDGERMCGECYRKYAAREYNE
jgi:hypothetical protein